MTSKLYRFLWNMLPSNCEKCKGRRRGVRGNEHLMFDPDIGKDILMCDYCLAEQKQRDERRRRESGNP